jgi:hypothetical protein
VEAITRKRGSTIMTSATEPGFKGSASLTKQMENDRVRRG